jgi:hypothetical protein
MFPPLVFHNPFWCGCPIFITPYRIVPIRSTALLASWDRGSDPKQTVVASALAG